MFIAHVLITQLDYYTYMMRKDNNDSKLMTHNNAFCHRVSTLNKRLYQIRYLIREKNIYTNYVVCSY